MSITYNTGIPASGNNPSNDQPLMLVNTNAMDSWTAVDHVGFNAASGGTHLQVTFSSKNAASAQTDPQAVLYTGNGTASTVADLRYRNQNGVFYVNPIRAWAVSNTGGIVSSQSFNVTSVTNTGTGAYSVVIPANILTGTAYGVHVTPQNATPIMASYAIVSATNFTIAFRTGGGAATDPTAFSFSVFQV